MRKKWIVTTLLLLLSAGATAQWKAEGEADSSRWDFHLSAGTTLVSGWGGGDAYVWTSPSVTWRANERLTLGGGFAYTGSLLSGYELQVRGRSLVPRRRGTQLLTAHAEAEYRVNDRLTLWGAVSHVGGWHEPLWGPRDGAFNVSATSVSGGFAYELSDASLIEMHFHFVHDHYGNGARGLLGHPWYGWGVPSYELYSGPWIF